jgi:pyruvate dehydrogenase E2 component (dihydrolipoamide acetyltransferase)
MAGATEDGIRRGGLVDRRAVIERLGARAQPVDPPSPGELVPLSPIRRRTAAHLTEALRTAAHALVVTEVDWSRVDERRRAERLTYLPYVARAVAGAVCEFPLVNATLEDDVLLVADSVELGIAVDLDHGGLVVPVVRRAETMSVRELADAIAAVADGARSKRLGPDAYVGGTFTLTNIGSMGTVMAAPIINTPQVAILSTDGVRMRPVAVPDGAGAWDVDVHPVGNLSLSFDHRAFDGAYAGGFLARVRELLER